MKAGVIGLGAMGTPMARYVHSKGVLTAVGNRTQSKADALASELDVRAARSAARSGRPRPRPARPGPSASTGAAR